MDKLKKDTMSEDGLLVANHEQQTLGLQNASVVRLSNQIEWNYILNSNALD